MVHNHRGIFVGIISLNCEYGNASNLERGCRSRTENRLGCIGAFSAKLVLRCCSGCRHCIIRLYTRYSRNSGFQLRIVLAAWEWSSVCTWYVSSGRRRKWGGGRCHCRCRSPRSSQRRRRANAGQHRYTIISTVSFPIEHQCSFFLDKTFQNEIIKIYHERGNLLDVHLRFLQTPAVQGYSCNGNWE
jgi:hypothetical protein